MECGDTPDHEDAACDMDQLESYFARRGQYEEAAMVNGASRRMREDSEELARLRAEIERLIGVADAAAEDEVHSAARIAELEAELSRRHAERVREIDAHMERVAELERMVVWAVRNQVEVMGIPPVVDLFVYGAFVKRIGSIDPSGILAAVKEAMGDA